MLFIRKCSSNSSSLVNHTPFARIDSVLKLLQGGCVNFWLKVGMNGLFLFFALVMSINCLLVLDDQLSPFCQEEFHNQSLVWRISYVRLCQGRALIQFLEECISSICHTFYLYFSLDLVLFHQSDAPVVLITNFFSLIQGVVPIRRFLQILSSQTECPKHKHSRISRCLILSLSKVISRISCSSFQMSQFLYLHPIPRDEFHEKCWAGRYFQDSVGWRSFYAWQVLLFLMFHASCSPSCQYFESLEFAYSIELDLIFVLFLLFFFFFPLLISITSAYCSYNVEKSNGNFSRKLTSIFMASSGGWISTSPLC